MQRSLLITIILISVLLLGKWFDRHNNEAQPFKPTALLYKHKRDVSDKLLMLDENKQPVQLSKIIKNKWVLLYFGYTKCPDVCPVDLAKINQAITKMQYSEKLQVVFISIDKKRDLKKSNKFAKQFNPQFLGFTASDTNLDILTKALGVYYEVAQIKNQAIMDHSKMDHSSMGNNYLINHTASFLLLDPNFKLTAILNSPYHEKNIANTLDSIIDSFRH